MNEKALRTLEYNKIIQKLSELAGSSRGKELCASLLPHHELSEITRLQRRHRMHCHVCLERESVIFRYTRYTPSLMRLKVGSSLGAVELLRISSVLDATLRIKAYGGCTGKDEDDIIEDP